MTTADWSGLPICILGLILGRLPIPDYLRCLAVCRTWRMAVAETPHCPSKPQLPWLMIPRQLVNGIEHCHRYFYSLSEKRFYHLHLPFLLRFLLCIGSSSGWFVMVDPVHKLHLLNPLTGAHRRLPSVTTFEDITGIVRGPDGNMTGYTRRLGSEFFSTLEDMSRYYSKVIVFSATVFVVHSSDLLLSYARPGDDSWTLITTGDSDYERKPPALVMDVAEYEGKFYVITLTGNVVVIDNDDVSVSPPMYKSRLLPPIWSSFRSWPDNIGTISRYYLVKSADGKDLLLVCRFLSSFASASAFVVLRLLDSQATQWVRVENLGDCALFIGENSISLAMSTEEAPELRGNCIYFTEVKRSHPLEPAPQDAGIFHLGDETITPCYDLQFIFQLDGFNWPPHLWFTPTL